MWYAKSYVFVDLVLKSLRCRNVSSGNLEISKIAFQDRALNMSKPSTEFAGAFH